MKIGVDAVILGAWADISGAASILDVGCGCGVIAMMCAQRNLNARVYAIDIDKDSVEECGENFGSSPWNNRLQVALIDFNTLGNASEVEKFPSKFDYLISNPPYFDSGVDNPDSVRLRARHQDAFSPSVLVEKGRDLLNPDGRIGLVVPIEQREDLINSASAEGLYLRRELQMSGREGRAPKRAFLEFSLHSEGKNKRGRVEEREGEREEREERGERGERGEGKGEEVENKNIGTLTIECADGSFTPEYISLCKDFYLKF